MLYLYHRLYIWSLKITKEFPKHLRFQAPFCFSHATRFLNTVTIYDFALFKGFFQCEFSGFPLLLFWAECLCLKPKCSKFFKFITCIGISLFTRNSLKYNPLQSLAKNHWYLLKLFHNLSNYNKMFCILLDVYVADRQKVEHNCEKWSGRKIIHRFWLL